jgi:DNA-directed RNA polymerase specialized sigma24 family protein
LSNDIAQMNEMADRAAAPPSGRYPRSAAAIAAVDALAGCAREEILDAFAETDEKAFGFRPAEALVTMLLQAFDGNDDRMIGKLFGLLRARSRPFIREWLGGIANIEDRKDIENSVFAKMVEHFSANGNAADYAQSKYWNYLRMRTNSAITEFQRKQRTDILLDDMVDGDADKPRALVDTVRDPGLSPEDLLLLKEAVAALPEPLRQTYILRHYAGWRVGDERADEDDVDPAEPTLKDHFGLTRRAIDKRLVRAEDLLAQYRKDPA